MHGILMLSVRIHKYLDLSAVPICPRPQSVDSFNLSAVPICPRPQSVRSFNLSAVPICPRPQSVRSSKYLLAIFMT